MIASMPATSDSSAPAPGAAAAAHLFAVLGLILFAYLLPTATANNDTWYHPEESDVIVLTYDGAAIATLAASSGSSQQPVIAGLTYAVALTVSRPAISRRRQHARKMVAGA